MSKKNPIFSSSASLAHLTQTIFLFDSLTTIFQSFLCLIPNIYKKLLLSFQTYTIVKQIKKVSQLESISWTIVWFYEKLTPSFETI